MVDLLGLLPDFVPERRSLLVHRQVAFDLRTVIERVLQDTLHPHSEVPWRLTAVEISSATVVSGKRNVRYGTSVMVAAKKRWKRLME